jgi:hypothetical protein
VERGVFRLRDSSGPAGYPELGMTPAEHGAAIVGPSIGSAASPSNGGGWVTPAEAALSLAIILALSLLWWRTLRPGPAPDGNDERA